MCVYACVHDLFLVVFWPCDKLATHPRCDLAFTPPGAAGTSSGDPECSRGGDG